MIRRGGKKARPAQKKEKGYALAWGGMRSFCPG